MTFITKRRVASLVSASTLIATLAVAAVPAATLAAKPTGTPSSPTASYFNGFEKAANTVSPEDSGTAAMFNVTRVAGTKSGIKAPSGAWHATAATDAFAFTRLGGYSATFPTNGYTTSVDVYLDMAQNASVGTDRRFDWTSAVSNATGGYGRDYVFNAGTNPAVAGQFLVSASNNADWAPGTSYPASALTISESGWYTFKHSFRNDGGALEVDMTVIRQGTVLKTWTLSPAEDTIGENGTIGGNRYGWLATNDFAKLALDNVTRVTN